MPADTDNLDDLFRQQLGQHATPPGTDLQRRLAELAEAERLDALFRTGLGSHASQPRRAVWERLEDEHLRPQPRRRRPVVAWWQLSAAAVLLLALLAGGLWRGGYWQPIGGLASRPADAGSGSGGSHPVPAGTARAPQPANPGLAQVAPEQALLQATTSSAEKKPKSFSPQATATMASSSSPSIATTTRPRRAATAPQRTGSYRPKPRPLDAAAGQLATTGRRNSPVSQPLPALPAAPAPAAHPSLPVVAMTSAPEVIEVEVRRGAAPASPAPAPVVAATESGPTRRPRLRLGGLLRQADHLVHGEPVSLAEATGLAETVTVQARFGGRTLSKTIQL